jgi:hypothetical protein
MAFTCPDCKSKALEIAQTLELPPDSHNDEITLQTLRCATCGLQALAVYEESRHGSLDSESWQYAGYRVSAEDFQAITQTIQHCPHSSDRQCQCATHQQLGQMTGDRWDGLRRSGVKIQEVFNIQLGST